MNTPDSLLKKYTHSTQAKKDIQDAIFRFNTFKLSSENFTFNDGNSRWLVKLHGVLPVTYQGKVYNFPLEIYFLEQHPHVPPMVFVRPTSMMVIKANKHVDSNGQVYHHYLNEWNVSRSTTVALLGVVQTLFGETPPLYSRPAPGSGNSMTGAAINSNQQPPYPGGIGNPYTPQPMAGYPMMNPSGQGPVTMPQPFGYPGMNTSYMPGTAGLPYPVANTNQMSATAYPTATVNEDTLRLSCLSAVEDKIRQHLREVESIRGAELDSIHQTTLELQQNKEKIDNYIRNGTKEKEELGVALEELRRENEELQKQLDKMDGSETLNVDDAFEATSPLYRQMLSTFAEEQAISDAIYYLSEALGKDVINVEVFLKKIRTLSRKQFMLRATIEKCRVQAGLPVS